MMATRREVFNVLCDAARELYGDDEARQLARMIIESRGVSYNQLIVDPNVELQFEDLEAVVDDIRRWRPVQHIIGTADFADMELEVTSDVLIPRPETEELVMWISEESHPGARIVDVCTGSGCIALALARAVKDSEVCGIELSLAAIDVARRNAQRYAPDVAIVQGDALADFSGLLDRHVDVVVSNPPYIPLSDKISMRHNVLDYEPSMALFVSDDDPLIFYRAIARTSKSILVDGGKLYFEIYERLADEMVAMLKSEGYSDIVVRDDFRGKPRMICAVNRVVL